MDVWSQAARAWRTAVVFVGVVALWGSTFIAVKYCLREWSPLEVVAGRYILGALILLPWAARAVRFYGKQYQVTCWSVLHLAIVGSLLPVGLMTWAQQSLPSSFAGMIASLAPLMTLLVGVVIWAQATRPLHGLGVVLGTCGVVVLRMAATESIFATNFSILALSAALLATVCWGLAAQHYRRHLAQLDPILTTALSFQVMAMLMGVFLLVRSSAGLSDTKLSQVSIQAWLYLIGLGALSALAVTGYNWLIVKWGALRASACTYVVPLIAVAWGVLDHEPVGSHVLIAGVLVGAAMWLVRLPVAAKNS